MTDQDKCREEACKLLAKQNLTGVVQHGHFGNYFFVGQWKPKDTIVSIYVDMHPCADQSDAKSFAESCRCGVVYSAMFEEFDDKYSPYMEIKARSDLPAESKIKWSHIYEVVSQNYAEYVSNKCRVEEFDEQKKQQRKCSMFSWFKHNSRKPKYRIVKHAVPCFGTSQKTETYWTIEHRSIFGLWSTLYQNDDPWTDHSRFSSLEKAEEMIKYLQRETKTEIEKEYY